MHKNFQYRLYPTQSQTLKLENTLAQCCWLYNHFLEERKSAYETNQKQLSFYGQVGQLKEMKMAGAADLQSVYSQTLYDVAMRLDLAYKAFFRRLKSGEKPGFPRFKSVSRYDSFTYPQASHGFKIIDNKLRLSKIGLIKIKLSRPIKGKIKRCTIKKSSTGKWYATFCCEIDANPLTQSDKQIGIDVGIKTFATYSDGQEIANPKFFQKEEKALAKAQRRLSKAEKGSADREKRRKIVARIHERIKWKRNNFSHQLSRKIVNEFGIICVEDLNINRMVHKNCLSKSIYDAAWSEFFSKLSYKAEEAGRTLVAVNPAYTSQDCSGCHHRQKLSLKDRTYECSCCGLIIDRDLNAAKNILAVGLHSIGLNP